MNRRRILKAIGAATAFAGVLAPVHAVANPFPNLPAAIVPVDDAALAGVRGKYVPPERGKPAASVALASTSQAGTLRAPADYTAASRAASPLAGVSGSGPIEYFGVAMTSTWTVTNGGVTQGVAVGADVGVSLGSHSVSISTWSSSQNGGLPANATPTGSSVNGTPTITNSGVGQNIQVAGNGNTVDNEASVQYGGSYNASSPVPATNTCGTDCTATVSSNAVSVAIDTPQGIVMQKISPTGIYQSAQVWSDLNTITNQLNVNVKTGSGGNVLGPVLNASQLQLIVGTP